MLYLAYGSNINREQMQRRCPGARFIKKMVLKDARLVFRHVLDVEYNPGSECPVILYEISAANEYDLDHYEGVASGYYGKEYVELENGEQALIYVMLTEGVCPPSKEYYARVKAGYEYFKMDLAPLRAALLHSWNKKEHTDETKRRARGRILQTHKGYKPKKAKKKKSEATLPMAAALRKQDGMARQEPRKNLFDWLEERKAQGKGY